jgi:hypothetical protein
MEVMATTSKKPVATTKEPERLYMYWGNAWNAVKSLNLPNMQMKSRSDKDFKPIADEMNKKKPPTKADWEWEFNWDSFEFDFHVTVGSKEFPLGNAKMNSVEVSKRKDILDRFVAAKLVTADQVTKYLAEAKKRAEKSAEIKKIDQEIQDELDGIQTDTTFKSGLAKSVEDLDRAQRQLDLMPIGDKIRLGAYVDFLYRLDGDFQTSGLMSFVAKDSKRPLLNFPPAIAEKLRQEFGADGKGKPDFKNARRIVVGVIDAKIMPPYRKEKTDDSNASIARHNAKIKKLRDERVKELAKH